MVKNLKTTFLGTTRNLPTKEELAKEGPKAKKKAEKKAKQGCLFIFQYRGKGATDPKPYIIMISPKWTSKKGKTYFTGVNLNLISESARDDIARTFGHLPVGSVSFTDIKDTTTDPGCCVRTYNVRNVRALHKVRA